MTAPMDKAFAERFAAEWIDAWNAHDRGRLVAEVLHFGPDGKVAKGFAHYAG